MQTMDSWMTEQTLHGRIRGERFFCPEQYIAEFWTELITVDGVLAHPKQNNYFSSELHKNLVKMFISLFTGCSIV